MRELVQAVKAWQAGKIDWDAVLEVARRTTPKAHRTYLETGWDGYQDEFPQPGTLDELAALRLKPAQYAELAGAVKAGG